MRKIVVDGVPHLCLFASKDLVDGDELRYDYKAPDLWWRKVSYFHVFSLPH